MNIEHRTSNVQRRRSDEPSRKITLHVTYYALLKERRGCAEETIISTARTGRELFNELSRRHGWTFSAERFRLAINDTFSDWQAPLKEGDRVAFIPPVAGG